MKEKQENVNQKKGISLIVLVITIIVIVILAVAVILSMANNNPISNANKAKFQNDMKSIKEEVELVKASNYAKSQGKSAGPIDFATLSSAIKYQDKVFYTLGELYLNSNKLSQEEKEWADEIGIKRSTDGLTTGYESEEALKDFLSGPNVDYDSSKIYIGKYEPESDSDTIILPEKSVLLHGSRLFSGKTVVLNNDVTIYPSALAEKVKVLVPSDWGYINTKEGHMNSGVPEEQLYKLAEDKYVITSSMEIFGINLSNKNSSIKIMDY